MRTTLFQLFFFFITISLYSQESASKINEDGKDFTQLKHAWRAQWITHPSASTFDFGAFLFRRSFEMKEVPSDVTIYISADNNYKLFVNGKYIGMGPETGDINHYRYETRNIASYLKVGKNLIAAEVINYGEYRKASQQTFQTAFICQFDDKLQRYDLNTGKAGWKVSKNEGRAIIPFASDSMRGYYAAGPCDILHAEKFPWNWQMPDFDDSNWQTPKGATVEFAVGRGFLYGSTWFLVPRKLPYLMEKKERFQRAFENEKELKMPFADNSHELSVPPFSKKSILLDNGKHTIGFPELFFSNGKNAQIKITYAEALFDSSLNKGNRNDIRGKKIFGYYDRIFPDGGVNRFFKTTSMRTFRYVQLDIETRDEALIINDFYNVFTAYPFIQEAKFHCENDTLNQIWETSWRTLHNSSFEDFIDPYYEQMQYVGDARIESLAALSMSGDKRLMKKAIESFDNSRLPIGLTQSRYPAYIVQVIPTYSLLWISMVHDYMMYEGDKNFINQQKAGIDAVLGWFEKRLDKTGMLTNLEWWNFTDWAIGYKNGIPFGADNGYSSTISLQYVMTLQKAAEIYNYVGETDKAKYYLKKAKSVSEVVMKSCFDVSKGILAETPEKMQFSQHTNILAILTNAFPPSKQQELMKKILADSTLIQTTIYFKFYLFEALHKVGLGKDYTKLLSNWKRMLANGQTTFAETDENPRSECHAWSASPLYHFNKIIVGVYPTKPEFKKVIIEPHWNDLKSVESVIPTPYGLLSVKYKNQEMEITVPENMDIVFKQNGKSKQLKSGKQTIKQTVK
jgi:hypothetical protein